MLKRALAGGYLLLSFFLARMEGKGGTAQTKVARQRLSVGSVTTLIAGALRE